MAFSDNITAYIPDYILVPSSFANAGDTGLTISTAYIAIKVSDLDQLTEAKAAESGGSSSFRTLAYALVKKLYDAIQAITAADRPTRLLIENSVSPASSGDLKARFEVSAELDIASAGTTLTSE